jgi:hypothetical protein
MRSPETMKRLTMAYDLPAAAVRKLILPTR